jgi:hypothetical protein
MKKLLQFLALTMFCAVGFCANTDSSVFSIPIGDQSIYFLGKLFGEVGTIIPGGEANIVKRALLAFNTASLALGGIVILYSMLIAILNTANDGEMMGKKYNSMWIPIRAALGVAALLPSKAGGYAVIQAIIMWVIVQGVGAADYVWNDYLDNFAAGTTAPVKIQVSQSDFTNSSIIFQNQVCAAGLAEDMNTTINTIVNGDNILFGVKNIIPEDVCGSAHIADNRPGVIAAAYDLSTSMIGSAYEYVRVYRQNGGVIDQATADDITRNIINAALSYGIHMQELAAAENPNTDSGTSNLIALSKESGWIYAGSFYMVVSRMTSSSYATLSNTLGPVVLYNAGDLAAVMGPYVIDLTSMLSTLSKQITETIEPKLQELQDMGFCLIAGNDSAECTGMIVNVTASASAAAADSNTAKLVDGFMTAVDSIINDFFVAITPQDGKNPLIEIAAWGQKTMVTLEIIWFGMVVGLSVMTVLAPLAGLIPLFNNVVQIMMAGLQIIMAFLSPFFFGVFTILFILSATCGFFLPMMPYMIYTLSVIAWFLLVIESMVAGPLLALGIVHPEGQHDVWGKAEGGIMILSGVFLRPVLTVIGLLAGSIMSYIVVDMLNSGFMLAFNSSVSENGAVQMNPWACIAFITLYSGFLLLVIQKSFSLIYNIPDKILRWIGGHAEQSGIEQDVGAMKQQMEQTAKDTPSQMQNSGSDTVKAVGGTADRKQRTTTEVSKIGGGGNDS